LGWLEVVGWFTADTQHVQPEGRERERIREVVVVEGKGKAWMDGWMDGWMGGWVDGWMNGRLVGWKPPKPAPIPLYTHHTHVTPTHRLSAVIVV
jgi:hypothetical protein